MTVFWIVLLRGISFLIRVLVCCSFLVGVGGLSSR